MPKEQVIWLGLVFGLGVALRYKTLRGITQGAVLARASATDRSPMREESAAEFEAKAKVRRAKVKADMEARAARALGIEESHCTDRRCAVCTDPDVCEQCRRGSTLVKTPPSGVDKPPVYDDAGWEVEDDVSNADWPKVCQACSTGCRACDDPSPAGCTACYPMYGLGSGGT